MLVRKVESFVSYAHHDRNLAEALLSELWTLAKPSKRFAYEPWQDTELLPGEDFDREIRAALARCDVGLLLLSPAFLGSKYVREVELRALLASKPVVPVLLAPVSFEHHDLLGLGPLQWFALRDRKGGLKAFADCDSRDRRRFVEALYDQLERRLEKTLLPRSAT